MQFSLIFPLAVMLLASHTSGSGGPVVEFRLYTHWNLKQLNRTMPEKPSKGYMMENNFSCQNGTVVLFYNWEENPFEMREFETFSKDMGMLFFKSVIVANYFKTIIAHFNQIPDVISNFIAHLSTETDCAYDNFEFFSDQIGVHIAAIVGVKLQGRIKRIVGLNPYSPSHTNIQPFRIQPSHAKFVEIYISQGRYHCSLKSGKPCGHANIVLNGGEDQPGCKSTFHFNDVFACNAFRAFEVFSEAYFRKSSLSKVFARVCPSYDKYVLFLNMSIGRNECPSCSTDGPDCLMMGEKRNEIFEMLAKHPPRWFYLNTKSDPPYLS